LETVVNLSRGQDKGFVTQTKEVQSLTASHRSAGNKNSDKEEKFGERLLELLIWNCYRVHGCTGLNLWNELSASRERKPQQLARKI